MGILPRSGTEMLMNPHVKDHYALLCCCLFFFRGEPFDRGLVHSIESVIIEWTHQIQSVLKRNSAQPLLEGHNPGPLVELDFWKARAANLECIFEQVSYDNITYKKYGRLSV